MRRLLGLLAVIAAAAATVPASATATHSNGQGPSTDFVTGTLKLTLPTPLGSYPGQIHNNGASDMPSGDGVPATGHFYMDIFDTPSGTVNLSGDIVCLTAIGNSAWMRAVVIDSNTDLAPPGFGVLSKVVDNGEGADDLPDAATGFLTPPPGPNPTCPTIPFGVTPSTQGNTTVHDGV
jgi:hypothetical protein